VQLQVWFDPEASGKWRSENVGAAAKQFFASSGGKREAAHCTKLEVGVDGFAITRMQAEIVAVDTVALAFGTVRES